MRVRVRFACEDSCSEHFFFYVFAERARKITARPSFREKFNHLAAFDYKQVPACKRCRFPSIE